MGNCIKQDSPSDVSNEPVIPKKKPTTKDSCHRSKSDNVVIQRKLNDTSLDSVLTAISCSPCSALSTIDNCPSIKCKHTDSSQNKHYVNIHRHAYNLANPPSPSDEAYSRSAVANNLNMPPLRLLPIKNKTNVSISPSPSKSWSSITNPYSGSDSASSSMEDWILYSDKMGSKLNNLTAEFIFLNEEIMGSEPSPSPSETTCSFNLNFNYNKLSINQSTTPILDNDEVSVAAEN